jgi:hypothetical protein
MKSEKYLQSLYFSRRHWRRRRYDFELTSTASYLEVTGSVSALSFPDLVCSVETFITPSLLIHEGEATQGLAWLSSK